MNMSDLIFPFTAIVGQNEMKNALILNVINRKTNKVPYSILSRWNSDKSIYVIVQKFVRAFYINISIV